MWAGCADYNAPASGVRVPPGVQWPVIGDPALLQQPRRSIRALERLRAAGIRYAGWLANCRAPTVFSCHRVMVHVPRWLYVEALPGIPTIRVFEALA